MSRKDGFPRCWPNSRSPTKSAQCCRNAAVCRRRTISERFASGTATTRGSNRGNLAQEPPDGLMLPRPDLDSYPNLMTLKPSRPSCMLSHCLTVAWVSPGAYHSRPAFRSIVASISVVIPSLREPSKRHCSARPKYLLPVCVETNDA